MEKTTDTERKKSDWFLIISKIYFFLKSKFLKNKFAKFVNSQDIKVCLRRNYQLFLIITHWSYLKCTDILSSLNVYKILWKEHEVVHRWAVDEVSVSEWLF